MPNNQALAAVVQAWAEDDSTDKPSPQELVDTLTSKGYKSEDILPYMGKRPQMPFELDEPQELAELGAHIPSPGEYAKNLALSPIASILGIPGDIKNYLQHGQTPSGGFMGDNPIEQMFGNATAAVTPALPIKETYGALKGAVRGSAPAVLNPRSYLPGLAGGGLGYLLGGREGAALGELAGASPYILPGAIRGAQEGWQRAATPPDIATMLRLAAPEPQQPGARPTLSPSEMDELNRALGLQVQAPEPEIKTGRGTSPPKRVGGGAPTTRLKGGGPVGRYVEGGSLTPEGQAEEARQAAAQQMQGAYQQPLNLQEIRQRLNLPANQPAPANWAKPTPPTPGAPGTEGLRPENVELSQNTQAIREHWAHRVAGEMLKDGIKNLDELSPIRQREYAANAGYDRGVQRGLSKEMKPIIQNALDTFWRTRGRR